MSWGSRKAPAIARLIAMSAVLLYGCSGSETGPDTANVGAANSENGTSPVRGVNSGPGRPAARPRAGAADADRRFRTIDGTSNNRNTPEMGAAGARLIRLTAADYGDGISSFSGGSRPNPRVVSNAIHAQAASSPNASRLSDYLWQWGQFLDHDIDLTEGVEPEEHADIPIPAGDEFFDPDSTGTQVMPFNRSIYDTETGTSFSNPREQVNEITAWIDASNVYGSDSTRAAALRSNDGTGRLKTSAGNLLPFNTAGLPNAGGDSEVLFLGGDLRANEQLGLTTMHTLFVREHNRLVGELTAANPQWYGERLYQEARARVGAQMQIITFQEFLPALLGPDAIPTYSGYDDDIDAGIANSFSTAAYRLGHSMLSDRILRLDGDGSEHSAGHLTLRDAFFQPARLVNEGGIEPMLRGLAAQVSQSIDHQIVDEVRNFLFGPPGAGGFDLVTLNIHRGRDHGLGSYNDLRLAMGLDPAVTFADITSDVELQSKLASVFPSPDDVDAWTGGLCEDHLAGAQVGELLYAVIRDQFVRLRDGDRYWYTRTLDSGTQRELESLRLSDIIRLNTEIDDEIANDVFRVP